MTDELPDWAAGTSAAPYALFLDFDGTLVDIAPRPQDVRVEPGLPDDLRALTTLLGGAVALVTGRAIADVERFLPGLSIDICGLHGLERRIAGHVVRPEPLPEIDRHLAELRNRLAAYPGVVLENKGVGIAVHWRLAPEAETAAQEAARGLAERLGPTYRLQGGKAVLEVVPVSAGKGAAIAALMEAMPYRRRLPVFAGDDRTDEDGFATIARLGGIGIKIGEGDTRAGYRMASPAQFRRWLRDWARDGRMPGIDGAIA